MKKLNIFILSILLVISCFSGCLQNTTTGHDENIKLKNHYIEGEDNQYMYSDNWYGTPLQHGEKGYYYLKDSFLYFIDDDTHEMYPLCNKSDCLHDKEKDDNKLNCRAYINCSYLPSEQKIQYYKGKIYYIFQPKDINDKIILRKFDVKTQNIEDAFELNYTEIDDWIIHRGFFYYANSVISNTDNEGNEYAENKSDLYRVNINSENSSPEIISNFDERGLSLQLTQNLQAYGNYIYYDANTVKKNTDILGSDNETFEIKRYCYDINHRKSFCLSENVKGKTPYFFGFFNNKILYLSGKKCIYTCDLNGKKTSTLFNFKNKFWGYNVFTDNKYIYFENLSNEIGKYYVFNANGENINTVKMPFVIDPQVPYDTKYIIRFIEENNDIEMVDKSSISSSQALKSESIYKFD